MDVLGTSWGLPMDVLGGVLWTSWGVLDVLSRLLGGDFLPEHLPALGGFCRFLRGLQKPINMNSHFMPGHLFSSIFILRKGINVFLFLRVFQKGAENEGGVACRGRRPASRFSCVMRHPLKLR